MGTGNSEDQEGKDKKGKDQNKRGTSGDDDKASKKPRLDVDDDDEKSCKPSIVDGNLTTLISGLILLFLGSGPIRGFAVTLSIGIVASMFTAIMLTRLIIVWWLRWKRPTALNI